jgi:hypothetical protein
VVVSLAGLIVFSHRYKSGVFTPVVFKYLIPLNRIRIEMPLDGGDGVSEQMIGVLR